jgi:hypothetical protein
MGSTSRLQFLFIWHDGFKASGQLYIMAKDLRWLCCQERRHHKSKQPDMSWSNLPGLKMATFFRAIQISRKYNSGEPVTKKREGKQNKGLPKKSAIHLHFMTTHVNKQPAKLSTLLIFLCYTVKCCQSKCNNFHAGFPSYTRNNVKKPNHWE